MQLSVLPETQSGVVLMLSLRKDEDSHFFKRNAAGNPNKSNSSQKHLIVYRQCVDARIVCVGNPI